MLTGIKLKIGVSRGPVGNIGIKGQSLSFTAIAADGVRRKVTITPYGTDQMRVFCKANGDNALITCAQYAAILKQI